MSEALSPSAELSDSDVIDIGRNLVSNCSSLTSAPAKARTVVRTGDQHLHGADVALAEGRFAVAEVEPPHPVKLFIESRRGNLFPVVFQIVVPANEGGGVVLANVLEVKNPKFRDSS